MNQSNEPKPGIYENVPFSTYLSWDALSNSRINLAIRSMAHYRYAEFKEQTKPLKLGAFLHCGILEPLSVIDRYAVMPAFELDKENKTKDGGESTSTGTTYVKQKRMEFIKANHGKQFVDKSDYETLVGVGKSIAADQDAMRYLSGFGKSELSIVWNDEETGLLCKARIDYKTAVIADLKTTEDASQAAFEKSIANYGYHRQAAHYRNGWAKLTGEIVPFVIVAVEKKSPYAVTAQPMCEEAIEIGQSELTDAIGKIANAKQSNSFPAYEKNGKWRLPSWYQLPEVQLTSNGESLTI